MTSDRARHCARPSCSSAADATLTYDYGERTAWLDPLVGEAHPMAHDLCAAHADALVVPLGWALDDRRTVQALFPSEYEETSLAS
jgi:hypothetical protein